MAWRTLVVAAAMVVAAGDGSVSGVQSPVGAESLGGIVNGPRGGEAGVWVIAETDDLDTRFRKIVVTDDDGRFLLPDLPVATYDVWVRGYGLADSTPVSATPGQTLTLTVRAASTPQEAAQVYPANYWYSLLEVPGMRQRPGTLIKTPTDWAWNGISVKTPWYTPMSPMASFRVA